MKIEELIFLSVQICTFFSFTWAAISFFKLDQAPPKDWRIFFIKYAGMIFIIWNLYAAFKSSLTLSLSYFVGCILFLLSLLVFWSAIYANRKSRLQFAFSGVNSSQVVKSGIYAVVRHPFYLSYSLAWLGGPVALQEWPLLVPFFAMGIVYLNAAREEEKYFLNSELKEVYRAYQAKSGMFFPKIFKRSV